MKVLFGVAVIGLLSIIAFPAITAWLPMLIGIGLGVFFLWMLLVAVEDWATGRWLADNEARRALEQATRQAVYEAGEPARQAERDAIQAAHQAAWETQQVAQAQRLAACEALHAAESPAVLAKYHAALDAQVLAQRQPDNGKLHTEFLALQAAAREASNALSAHKQAILGGRTP